MRGRPLSCGELPRPVTSGEHSPVPPTRLPHGRIDDVHLANALTMLRCGWRIDSAMRDMNPNQCCSTHGYIRGVKHIPHAGLYSASKPGSGGPPANFKDADRPGTVYPL
jgi:hypothetical protein